MALSNWYSQAFPPDPTFTDADVPTLSGRVFIVTGGNQGLGYELCKILYTKGGTVYMASRSKERAEEAIGTIIATPPVSGTAPGILRFLYLDLEDLATVRPAAASFAEQESKLDVLWNQAGIGGLSVPPGTKTKQGIEQFLGVHCVAPLLFTQLLLPQLRTATKSSPAGSVRVIWTSSWLAEGQSPKGGIDFNQLGGTNSGSVNYSASKAGNWLLADEMARRYGSEGIVSVAQNPGNVRTNSYAGVPWYLMPVLKILLYEVRFGAYTELYAGLSSEIDLENNGSYVMPWGRLRPHTHRADIIQAIKPEAEGGQGAGKKFWDWCEEQWKAFV